MNKNENNSTLKTLFHFVVVIKYSTRMIDVGLKWLCGYLCFRYYSRHMIWMPFQYLVMFLGCVALSHGYWYPNRRNGGQNMHFAMTGGLLLSAFFFLF